MAGEKSKEEIKQDVVKFLVKKSQAEDRKPQPNNADVDQKEVEAILNRIRKNIQEKKR